MKVLLKKYKKKIRKISIPIVMLFISSAAQASCSKLAKAAGMSQVKLEKIVNKLVKIESTSGKYNVKNSVSGAYGRYQIIPSTAKFYAKKLNIPKNMLKKPYNQYKIFKAIMKDNIKSLKKRGLKVTAFSLYATHQQGAG
ncbi:MAG: transglycosylase SLT domain-containing protein, partial [Sulfurovum sp.]